MLGRYESYDCSENGYRSVATQSSFGQAGPRYFQAAGGCSSASFEGDNQARITTSVNTTCPGVDGGEGRLQMRFAPIYEAQGADIAAREGPLCLNGASTISHVGSLMVVACLSLLSWSVL